MSSHDSTMAHQAPADLASRGPVERQTLLRRLEARMAESGLRGHIYT